MRSNAITLMVLLLLCLGFMAFLIYLPTREKPTSTVLNASERGEEASYSYAKLLQKAVVARQFTELKNYNSDFYFLVDMGMPSGKKRFFIYDLNKDSIINSGLVTHGNCNEYWLEEIKFDNTVGCGCTSLGKYKIGFSYFGKFGLAFKLHGLEESNNNAFRRYIVLHAHDCVPDFEVEDEICQSLGCPTVSPLFLKELETLIKNSKKPILLWMVK